jgi:branched-subunit amino acid ABC-type transport system permease component
MSTAKDETNCPPADQNVERRIKNFRNLTITALCNITVLILLVVPLWMSIPAFPFTYSMSFPLRWVCIVFVYLEFIFKNAKILRILTSIGEVFRSESEREDRSPNPDLGTRITNLEDWMLANFCVIVGLATIYFVGQYWIDVISLTVRTFFYWVCTMGGLCLLFWLLKRTIRFYRKVKGLHHDEAWAMLVGITITRFYDKFEGLNANGVLG